MFTQIHVELLFVHINRQKLVFYFIYFSSLSLVCVSECVVLNVVSHCKLWNRILLTLLACNPAFDRCLPSELLALIQVEELLSDAGLVSKRISLALFIQSGNQSKRKTHLNPASKNYRILMFFVCLLYVRLCYFRSRLSHVLLWGTCWTHAWFFIFFIRLLLILQIFCLFVWVWCCHFRTYSNAGHTALSVSQNADFGLCSVFFMFRFDYDWVFYCLISKL